MRLREIITTQIMLMFVVHSILFFCDTFRFPFSLGAAVDKFNTATKMTKFLRNDV